MCCPVVTWIRGGATNSWSFHSKPETFDRANIEAAFGTSKSHLSPSVQSTIFLKFVFRCSLCKTHCFS